MAEPGRTAPAPLGRVFVVGGTGMLAEAVAKIATRCDHLTLAARAPEGLARRLGAHPLPLDWTDRPTTLRALPETRFDLVISWLHRAGLWMVPHLEARLRPGGRSIRVLGSVALDPAHLAGIDPPTPAGIRRQRLVLGRMGARWLTHEEICAGLMQAIDAPGRDPLILDDAEGQR